MRADDPAAFWLGDAEGRPPHWGGAPRRAEILSRATLGSGRVAHLVRLEPPLVVAEGHEIAEAIVAPRYAGPGLEFLGSAAIVVNVLGPAPGVDLHKPRFEDGELVVEFWADAAASLDALPKPIDEAAFWSETLERIRRFVETHGHSRVPDGYEDDRGRLDVIVGNLRWHHGGKAGVSPGPFPGIDYAADLDRLPGWEW